MLRPNLGNFHKASLCLWLTWWLWLCSSESGHIPSTVGPTPMPNYCLTSSGRRYKEGDSWHDGCRDCYCHSGREMCVLISCPVPTCSHPVVKPDQCCPTCEGMSQKFKCAFIFISSIKGQFQIDVNLGHIICLLSAICPVTNSKSFETF